MVHPSNVKPLEAQIDFYIARYILRRLFRCESVYKLLQGASNRCDPIVAGWHVRTDLALMIPETYRLLLGVPYVETYLIPPPARLR